MKTEDEKPKRRKKTDAEREAEMVLKQRKDRVDLAWLRLKRAHDDQDWFAIGVRIAAYREAVAELTTDEEDADGE